MLFIDHQIGLLTGVRDMNVAELKHNVVALAKAARVLGVPIVVTATAPDGMWGPTMPELTAAVPGVQVINRTTINSEGRGGLCRAGHSFRHLGGPAAWRVHQGAVTSLTDKSS